MPDILIEAGGGETTRKSPLVGIEFANGSAKDRTAHGVDEIAHQQALKLVARVERRNEVVLVLIGRARRFAIESGVRFELAGAYDRTGPRTQQIGDGEKSPQSDSRRRRGGIIRRDTVDGAERSDALARDNRLGACSGFATGEAATPCGSLSPPSKMTITTRCLTKIC